MAAVAVTADQLRQMSTEQLGLWILAELTKVSSNERHLRNFTFKALSAFTDRPAYQTTVVTQQQILSAHGGLANRFATAWQWLLAQGFIASDPQQSNPEFVTVTQEGRAALNEPNVLASLNARQLLGRDLDSKLAKAKRTFEAGDYDTAVHQALKEVEVQVRAAGGFPDTVIGVDLVTQAFRVGGPLADGAAATPEQEGVMQLFRGAFAAYRNPVSHRHIEFADPAEAAEVILLANLLLRIVTRAATTAASAP